MTIDVGFPGLSFYQLNDSKNGWESVTKEVVTISVRQNQESLDYAFVVKIDSRELLNESISKKCIVRRTSSSFAQIQFSSSKIYGISFKNESQLQKVWEFYYIGCINYYYYLCFHFLVEPKLTLSAAATFCYLYKITQFEEKINLAKFGEAANSNITAIALCDYNAPNSEHLSFKSGQTISQGK